MSESGQTGLPRHGIRPQTILREPTTNAKGTQICPEDGRPVGRSLGTQTIAHPVIVDDDLDVDELRTHGWLCAAHTTPIVMPRRPSEMPAGWVAVEVVIADQRTREIPVPRPEVEHVE